MGPRSKAFLSRVRDGHAWLRDRGPVTLAAALLLEISAGTPATGPDARRLLRAAGVLLVLFIVLIGAAIDGALSALAARVLVASLGAAAWARRELLAELGPVRVPDALLLDRKGKPLRGAVRTARAAALARDLARDARARTLRGRAEVLAARATRAARPTARWTRSAATRAVLAVRPAATAVLARIDVAARALGALAGALSFPSVPAPSLPVRTVRVITVGVLMSFVFATVIGTTGLVATRGTVALGASTTLAIISGDVRVIDPGRSDPRAAVDGEVLQAGLTILTGSETYAVLTYFEGSTVSIDPDTTLVIEALQANPDGSTIIGMRQDVGQTWHAVTKLLTAGSKYEVRTPTATATVRGTLFLVGVRPAVGPGVPETVIHTTEGAVAAERPPTPEAPEGEEVIIAAGFTVTARPAEAIPPPVPAPEPERKVTVTVGAANSLVVDPQGRANGERDGRLVVQTPGATVERVDGKVVVTMPNISDGKVSTVIDVKKGGSSAEESEDVEVVTVVEERGRRSARSERTVRRSEDAPTVTGTELRRSTNANDATAPPDLRQLDDSETTPPVIKVSEVPVPPVVALGRPQGGSGGPGEGGRAETVERDTTESDQDDDEDENDAEGGAAGSAGGGQAGGGASGNGGGERAERREEAPRVPGIVQPIVTLTLPPLSGDDVARREKDKRETEERSRQDNERQERERRAEEDRRLAELRAAEQRANVDVERLSGERRQAEQRAGDRREQETPRPEPQGLIERVVQLVTPSEQDQDDRRVREARGAEEKAKQEATKRAEELRKAEEKARADAIKAQEEMRKEAEKRADELRQAEAKAKEDAAKKAEEFRKLEEKAREQASKLAEEQRKEAEKRLDEFRKAEEKARAEAAKRLEEQRKAEDKAREEAAKRLEELRKEEAKAREEQAKREEEKRREQERERERGSGFVPTTTLKPLPDVGNRGNDAGSRGNDGGSRGNDAGSRGNDAGSRGNDAGSRGNETGSRGNDAGSRGNDAGSRGAEKRD